MRKNWNKLIISVLVMSLFLGGCSTSRAGGKIKLDPKNPVVVSIWHYYNGSIMNAFNEMIVEFNETIGEKMGIIVESYGMGNVSELENAVISAANKEVGSLEIPNIFASYADTAYQAEKMGLLASLDGYFSDEEREEFIDSYIEEGKIGINNELRIFPIAKSTEILLLNETDWLPFAEANNITYDELATIEGLARTAELYYKWTDSLTEEIPNDGKSFYGRDSMANMFIISAKEFGTEIFSVKEGTAVINADAEVMRKIWDYYYVPYISGYYYSYGKFRSDDTKVGDIIAYVGSTSSATYFPTEITVGSEVYPINAVTLPAPHFEGADSVLVQQGAGMVVTKSTPQEEYASVTFLKWFTQEENNIKFSMLSGYMPVKKSANDYEKIVSAMTESGHKLSEITKMTLETALADMAQSELYTNKAFSNGAAARSILEKHLQEKAVEDREAVIALIENGSTHEQAVAEFNTDEHFNSWLEDFTQSLNEIIKA